MRDHAFEMLDHDNKCDVSLQMFSWQKVGFSLQKHICYEKNFVVRLLQQVYD